MSLNEREELNKLLPTPGLTNMRQKSQSSSALPCHAVSIQARVLILIQSAGVQEIPVQTTALKCWLCPHRQGNIFSPLSVFDSQWIPKLMTHVSEASFSLWISHHEWLSISKLMLIVPRTGKEASQQCSTEELSQLSHTPCSQRQGSWRHSILLHQLPGHVLPFCQVYLSREGQD